MSPPQPARPIDCHTFWKWTWHRCFHDCCAFHRPPHLQNHAVDWWGFIWVFSTKFILEVCGAAGAVWGFSEVIQWRTPGDENYFRGLCAWTFCIFLVRFYWHAKHWLEHEHDFPFVKIKHRRQHVIHFIQVFAAKLLLQVCGAAGAIWGASEVFGLRSTNDNNNEWWRHVAILTGNLFFLRWVLEIMSYCLLFKRCVRLQEEEKEKSNEYEHKTTSGSSFSVSDKLLLLLMKIVNLNQSITVKFVLEVCGGTGAVWGFSEIVSWRHEGNSEVYWRPGAIAVGVFFAIRWMWQIIHLVVFDNKEHHHYLLVTEPLSHQKRTSVVLAHKNLHVSNSMRRLSQTAMLGPSFRALGIMEGDLDLEEDDLESPSTTRRDDTGDDALNILSPLTEQRRGGAEHEEDIESELQKIATSDAISGSSYHSCD